jgi:hypothetical protein
MSTDEKKVARINAFVEAVLFRAGEPLLVLLTRKSGAGKQYFVASAIPDDDDNTDYFFVVSVGRTHMIRYFDGQCDLRYLYAFASGRKYFIIKGSMPEVGKSAVLEAFDGSVTENLLPDSRFFATAHTSEYGRDLSVHGSQSLVIDGEWDMQEFGNFYQKFSDIYSYEQAISYVRENDAPKIKKVETAFRTKPFRGGSSYMNFFDDLQEIIPSRERPGLDGITYNSPGHVDLRGNSEILEAVREALIDFLERTEVIDIKHKELRSFMSKERLLRITGGVRVASPEVATELSRLTAGLLDVLPISGKDYLRDITAGNLIVLAKISLALYRRLKATAMFFAQGRLGYSDN